jgi:HAD superfamily hydrolase (TIGR01509 family)
MTPQAVVFDIGNVLLDFDYRKTAARIERQCEVPAAELHKIITSPSLFNEFESGRITGAQYFERIQKLSGYCGTQEEFAEPFGDIFTEIPEMISFNENLRVRGIPTYILSNTNEFSIAWIRKRYPFFANFTDYIFSHEHNCMKPGAHIYEVVEEKSGLRGPALFYMDDREENIAAAIARGWQAVVHTTPGRTLEIARNLGL